MGAGCSAAGCGADETISRAARGPSYDPRLDYRVPQLAAELGEEVLHAICFEFYRRVEGDTELPEFAGAFSTPAAPASELLCWFLMEAWGSERRLYSAHRGSHFPFLHSTHRVWSFHLNEEYWQRWIYHFLGAAQHYRTLQEQQRARGNVAVTYARPDPSPLSKRLQSRFPEEAPHQHVTDMRGIAMCPFARMAMARPKHDGPQAPPPAVAAAAAAAAAAVSAPSSSGADLCDAAGTSASECGYACVTANHLEVIHYYLLRLREWMDQDSLKTVKYVHYFDHAPAPAAVQDQPNRNAKATHAKPYAPQPPSAEQKQGAGSVTSPAVAASPSPAPSASSPSSASPLSSVAAPVAPLPASPSPVAAVAAVAAAAQPAVAAAAVTPSPSSPTARAAASGYTTADVAQHASASSAWTIIDGKVYDLTDFYKRHPGGASVLQSQSFGRDCSEAFHEAHDFSTVAQQTLQKLLIGTLIRRD